MGMILYLKMTLQTDAIFGNGASVPGGEDISVLSDEEGFPYFRAGTFKGIFREELENLTAWQPERQIDIERKMGGWGDDELDSGKLRFSDFKISDRVKKRVKSSAEDPADVLDAFTYFRTFTAMDEESGIVKKGSLRVARCVKKGITFYGSIDCEESDLTWIEDVLGLIKWVGTMRNRGFGEVQIQICREGENL